jgi:CRISPR-associated endonuclease Csn1
MERLTTLGIDLGTNSLGWCLVETDGEPGQRDNGRILDIGVRIFSQAEMAGRDPQSKTSLAVARRLARSMRRRRDRYLRRRERLLDELTAYGFLPSDETERNALFRRIQDGDGGDVSTSVHAFRARALDQSLHPHEIGRILFQLNERRGFKSNRKTDRNEPDEGKIASAISRLEEQIETDGARTFGEWLFKRRLKGLSVRARMSADGKSYDFYPSRAALENEYDWIMRAQKRFQPERFDDAAVEALRETIFFQRDLRPVLAGKCSYNPSETRLAKSHPLFQAFRLVKEVNELEIVFPNGARRKLTPDQRNALLNHLRTSLTKEGKAPFSKLRNTLKLPPGVTFNKETDNRKDIEGDIVYFRMSQADRFGVAWSEMPVERQALVTESLRKEPDRDVLVAMLESEFGLPKAKAEAVGDTNLPDGFGRLGPSALAALTDAMLNETDENGFVITEARAAQGVYGRTNSEGDPNRKGVARLPKYQVVLERHVPPGIGGSAEEHEPNWDEAMGRITNPTVHIALNQLRRVVNALIRKHGRPDRIAIELGRDLKFNDQARDEINKRIGQNTREAQARSVELREVHRVEDNGYNRLRLKLWKESGGDTVENRVCVYCGTALSASMLFNGDTDIDHILPWSKTLDDSQSNRVLCCTRCNRLKGNRTPAQVPQWRANYADILERATALPKAKRWRFAEDAMERFGDEEGFLARQITDMQYVSRLALTYLAHLYDAEEAGIDGVFRSHSRVRALPGRMTEMLRRNWALNDLLYDHNIVDPSKPKNRLDHRHHAIDAAVIACTSRALIQKLATASASAEEQGAERLSSKVSPPWPNFREELRERIRNVVVSHKPDHGTVSRAGYTMGRGKTAAKLHNDTAYGPTGEKDEKGNDLVVRRIPVTNIKKRADLALIRTNQSGHSELRDRLFEATRDLEGKAFEAAVAGFAANDAKFRGIRHVRIIEPLKTIPIKDKGGRVYKGYKGDSNHRYDVWMLPDGKWESEVVSTFDAHRPDFVSSVRANNPTARKVLSLHQGDMVAIEDGGSRRICRVVKFSGNGQLFLADHNEAGALKSRDAENNDPFKYMSRAASALEKLSCRQIRINEIGGISDPGLWWRNSGN